MQVRFKLYATLAKYLPPQAARNEVMLEVADGATVYDVLTSHNVPMETCHLVLINGVFAPPSNARETVLKPGDTLAVWPPVAGG